jgi:hypothetical protein
MMTNEKSGDKLNHNYQAIQQAIIRHLPSKAHWVIRETSADYDFSTARYALRTPSAQDFNYDCGDDWDDLLLFGVVDYDKGGGSHSYLCIRKSDGRAISLDVERLDADGKGEAVSVLNSSIQTFIDAWAYLNLYLGQGKPLPSDAGSKLRLIDPDEYSHSEWKRLVDYVTEDA